MARRILLLIFGAILLTAVAVGPVYAQLSWKVHYTTPHLSFNIGSGSYLGLHHIYRYPFHYRHFYGGPAYSIGLRPYSPVAYSYYSPRSYFYHGYAPYYSHYLSPSYYPYYPVYPAYPAVSSGYRSAAVAAAARNEQGPQQTVNVSPQVQVVIQNNTRGDSGSASRVTVRQGRSWDSGLWRAGDNSAGVAGSAGTAGTAGSAAIGGNGDGDAEVILDQNGTVYHGSRQIVPEPAARPDETERRVAPAERDDALSPLPRRTIDTEAAWLMLIRRGSDDERRQAAMNLAKFPSSDAVAALVEALRQDGSEAVRSQAAYSLGSMLALETLDELRAAARTDRDTAVRSAALVAAQKIEAYYRLR